MVSVCAELLRDRILRLHSQLAAGRRQATLPSTPPQADRHHSASRSDVQGHHETE